MNSVRFAFYVAVMAMIWSVLQVRDCNAISLDTGTITDFGLVRAFNPTLTPLQALQDAVCEGNVVVYIGNAAKCNPCRNTIAALIALCVQYPNIIFIKIDSVAYAALRTMRTIPELRFYKNGSLIRVTGSQTLAQLKVTLDSLYK